MSSPECWLPIRQALRDLGAVDCRDARRLLHGRGGCYPGLEWCSLDLYWPVLLLTVYQAPPEGFRPWLLAELKPQAAQPAMATALVVQHRYQPGAPSECWYGALPEKPLAQRGDLRFHIGFDRQNVGYFLDMEPGRQWLEARARGKRVLNLFAYSCAFSVVAMAAGAEAVVNVDMSRSALSIGRENHRLNRVPNGRAQFLPLDILKSWSRIRRRGPYDLVVIDPPSYQKGSFVAVRDYPKLVRRIPEWVRPGGKVLACLNAPELSSDFLREVFAEHSPACILAPALPPAAGFIDREPERQLKLVPFHYSPASPQ